MVIDALPLQDYLFPEFNPTTPKLSDLNQFCNNQKANSNEIQTILRKLYGKGGTNAKPCTDTTN